jgi:hypothetical protein
MAFTIYKVTDDAHVVEEHVHNNVRFLGARAGWDGTDEVNAASNDSLSPFTLVAGNDDWGTPLCILGSGDTPVQAGMTKFDHRYMTITSSGGTAKIRLRIAWGASYAAAILAGTFTEFEFQPISGTSDSGFQDVEIKRLAKGTKVFAAIWQLGQNGNNLVFTTGVHEYDN